MNPLIEPIERALADSADPETKKAAASACRTLLAAFEAEPGQALTVPAVQTRPSSPLSNMTADQFFDVLIAKLTTMVDAKGGKPGPATTSLGGPLRIPMIVLPPAK